MLIAAFDAQPLEPMRERIAGTVELIGHDRW